MTIHERKECDEREHKVWAHGYRFGFVFGFGMAVIFCGSVAALALKVFWK